MTNIRSSNDASEALHSMKPVEPTTTFEQNNHIYHFMNVCRHNAKYFTPSLPVHYF